jgi:hypothetical protein
MTKTAPRQKSKRFARDPQEQREPRRKWGAATIALVTALVALASGALGLIFDVRPDLRPDPRTTLSAEISVFAVERDVTTEDWLRRVTRSDRAYRARLNAVLAEQFEGGAPPTPEEIDGVLKAEGELAYVKTHIVGFKRRSLTLRWSIYDARRLRRVQDLANATGAEIIGQAPSDASVSLVFLPLVPRPGQYFARFEIVDEDGTMLAVADSQKFPGLS